MLPASLTFFTVFSVASPTLVVVLWGRSSCPINTRCLRVELPTEQYLLTRQSPALKSRSARAPGPFSWGGEVTGLVGLVAFLYVAMKMFSVTATRAPTRLPARGPQGPPARPGARISGPPSYVARRAGGRRHPAVSLFRNWLGSSSIASSGGSPDSTRCFVVAVGFGVPSLPATLALFDLASLRASPSAPRASAAPSLRLRVPSLTGAYVNLQLGVLEASPLTVGGSSLAPGWGCGPSLLGVAPANRVGRSPSAHDVDYVLCSCGRARL